MKKLNYRAGVIALAATLALNGAHMLAYFYQAKSQVFDVLASVVGWGVDFPGMVAAIAIACLGGTPIFWLADAGDSESFVLAAIAIFSGCTWFLVAGLIFRKKPDKTPQTTIGEPHSPSCLS